MNRFRIQMFRLFLKFKVSYCFKATTPIYWWLNKSPHHVDKTQKWKTPDLSALKSGNIEAVNLVPGICQNADVGCAARTNSNDTRCEW